MNATRPRKPFKGFTMIELVFSIGLIAVAVLALMGLAVTSVNARQKGRDTEVAQQVARGQLQRVVDSVRVDSPAGFRAKVFNHTGTEPFEAGDLLVGNTTFSYALYANTLQGTAEPNRLAQIKIEVWWWGDQGETRQGMGRLSYKASRLLNEPDASS